MLTNISKEMVILFLFGGVAVICLILIGIGIYFYKNRKRIEKKYDIDYFVSFIFGAFTLTPITIGGPALLFAPDPIGMLAFTASAVYLTIPIIICLCASKGKPHRIGRIFIMILFTASILGFLIGILASTFWKNAKYSSRGPKTTEDMLREHIDKANKYYDMKETEYFYKGMKGKW